MLCVVGSIVDIDVSVIVIVLTVIPPYNRTLTYTVLYLALHKYRR